MWIAFCKEKDVQIVSSDLYHVLNIIQNRQEWVWKVRFTRLPTVLATVYETLNN